MENFRSTRSINRLCLNNLNFTLHLFISKPTCDQFFKNIFIYFSWRVNVDSLIQINRKMMKRWWITQDSPSPGVIHQQDALIKIVAAGEGKSRQRNTSFCLGSCGSTEEGKEGRNKADSRGAVVGGCVAPLRVTLSPSVIGSLIRSDNIPRGTIRRLWKVSLWGRSDMIDALYFTIKSAPFILDIPQSCNQLDYTENKWPFCGPSKRLIPLIRRVSR